MRATFQILGRLTQDPELRTTAKGTGYAKFSIAVNRYSKDQDGSPKQETDFFNITMWGKKAENFCKFHAKGNLAFIDGILKINTWEKDGQKRRDVEIVGLNFDFVNSKPKNDGGETSYENEDSSGFSQNYEDDEVPF